ncbi:DUF6361 family protein [Arthrobacter gengyunqii]|uniref:DUF6361 family protein n=1 Tax=Arthrobacter gengyunqii TaxID=2886940 RepID=A0A9X1M2G7_9MICC|nr:DUF6361 family protein [Arthrobacter gengyunqii]MCC3270099.1 DUF6361 family protein [Arthrobacter gengyunqii]UOY96807.1 DUF6361 family protein [Arthrobacter gengyunqii]
MTSHISWLDANTDENNRMRELVKLFSTPETIDDLGIGQIRDVISNSLFPGTSVLHAGARYLLLVPWAYLTAAAGTSQPDVLKSRAEKSERALIDRLGEISTTGFIGSSAGNKVRQLPSAAYWSALRRYEIVHPDIDRAGIAEAMCAARANSSSNENAETAAVWAPSLPQPPEGFPYTEENGLALTHAEASWLQERLLASCRGTLLAHFVVSRDPLAQNTTGPWQDPISHTADARTVQWVRDAELFSFVHNGANILYQHLLAELSAKNLPDSGITTETTNELLQEWETERDAKKHLLASWNVDAFLDRIREANPAIRGSTVDFARTMAAAAQTFSIPLADNPELRRAVEDRERLMKKANSRFRNHQRLRAWAPPERGVAALTYRWAQVRRTVRDIHDGLALGPEHAHA